MSQTTANDLAQARVNCSPKPLPAASIDDFWVETAEARDALTSFRGNLSGLIHQEDAQRILVYGHRGCGKSTELNKLISELGPEWLTISLNAADYLPVSGNEAADVLLAACTRIIEVARDQKLPLNESVLKPVLYFFKETTETQESSRDATLEVGAGVDTSASLLDKLIGLSAKFTSALKFGSRTGTSTVHIVRQRKGELREAVNALGLATETAWREKTKNPNAKVLLVIEDLDKLGLADSRQIFVNDGRLLGDIALRTVYTIPVFTFHSPEANAIKAYFDHTVGLPMIKINTRGGEPCEEGRAALRAIIRKRVDARVLPDDAMEHLIERTGGVLRDIFDAIQSCAQFLPVQKSNIIDRDNIGIALDRMVATIGLQIGYPPEEKRSPRPLQERLAAIAKARAEGEEVPTQPDPDMQYLLMSGALIEYNGDPWLGVHPLAKEYLRELGFDVDPSQTALPELAQYLNLPNPGLALLRYRSVHAFDALLQSLHPDGRQIHRVSYRPRSDDERASPPALVQRCRDLATPAIPIIFLCPDPDTEAASDLEAQALFWKNMNANREALGALSVQLILTLDEAQTASCFHHAKDLVSWCSPKFELAARAPSTGDPLTVMTEKTRDGDTPATSALTWDTLYPLLQEELQSGLPLPPRAVTQLLFPLMRHALDAGKVSQATLLLPAGDEATFPDERERSVWLSMKGDLAVAQGDLAAAVRYFAQHLAIAERLAASDPANTAWQRDLIISYERLGDVAKAQGYLSAAADHFEKCRQGWGKLIQQDPANISLQRAMTVPLNRLGDLAVSQGDLAAAAHCFAEAKTIAERLATSDPTNAEWQRDLSVSLSKLGDLAVAQGDLAAAARYFAQDLAIAERLAARDPANAEWQRDLSVSLNKLGNLAAAQGDLAAAARCFAEAKTIGESLAASDPSNAMWQRGLSVSLNKLGDLAVAQGDLAAAARYFAQDLAIAERLAARDPANAVWQRDLAFSHFKRLQLAQQSGDEEMMQAELQAGLLVLEGMKQRGMHMDAPLEELHKQLAGMSGGE